MGGSVIFAEVGSGKGETLNGIALIAIGLEVFNYE